MKRRGRMAIVSGVVAMVMAVLAVCPCPPMTAVAATADPHGCCASGKAGLTIATDNGSCCADEARALVATSSVPVAVAAGWATDVVSAPALLPVPSIPAVSIPLHPAPLILRI